MINKVENKRIFLLFIRFWSVCTTSILMTFIYDEQSHVRDQ